MIPCYNILDVIEKDIQNITDIQKIKGRGIARTISHGNLLKLASRCSGI